MKENESLKQTTDFRLYLQKELVRRCEKNPSYSLRAFAKTLGIHHAALSLILRSKRKITKKTQTKFAKALGLGPADLSRFHDPESEGALKLDWTLDGKVSFEQLAIDTFEAVSDWYHDAILELTRVESFNGDTKWISKVLGVSVNEINIAVERLQRLGMLEITKKNLWIDKSGDNTISGTDFTSTALRNLQKHLLEKAIHALEEIPKSEREHASMMMAVSTEDLPEVKRAIHSFNESLCKRLQRRTVKANQVYQLCVSFFPLTKIITEE